MEAAKLTCDQSKGDPEDGNGTASSGRTKFKVKLNVEPVLKEKVQLQLSMQEDNEGDVEKVVCCVCRKDFPSKKALFGHMRCHPERHWRGIHPPDQKKTCSTLSHAEADQNSDQNNNSVDLLQFGLPKWGMKGARSPRRPVAEASDDDDDLELENGEDDVKDVVHGLNSLSKSRPNKSASLTNDAAHKSAGGYNVAANNMATWKDVELMDEDEYYNQDVYEHIKNSYNQQMIASYLESSDMKSYGNSLKKRKLNDLEIVKFEDKTDPIAAKYKCNICDKIFPSYQALGGHVSSNNKSNNWLHLPAATQDVQTAAEAKDGANACDQKMKKVVIAHECEICKKVFPTGQALGGHKRCHTSSNSGEAGSSSQASRNSDEAGSSTQVMSTGEASSSSRN